MTPLEMIAEWRKGCTVSQFNDSGSTEPEQCPECTRALIDCLEHALIDEKDNARPIVRLRYIWISGLLVGIPVGSVLGMWSAFLWLPIAGWGTWRIWKENQ